MEILFQNIYLKLFYDSKHHLLFDEWTPETELMMEEEFKELILLRLKFIKEKKVKVALTNTKDFAFPVHPELQDWLIANSNQVEIEYGLEKHSFVMPQNFIANLGMNQFIDEVDERRLLDTAYFADIENAKQWLLK